MKRGSPRHDLKIFINMAHGGIIMIRNEDILNCLPLLASILGNRPGLKIRKGKRASADGETIRLPDFPASDDAIALIRGYVDHEAAHIRFTDFAVYNAHIPPLTRHLCNSIEDCRVEKCMGKLYPGCESNLSWLARQIFLTEKTWKSGANPAFSVLSYVLLSLRSCELEELKTPLAKTGRVLEKAFPGLSTKLDKTIAEIKESCPGTKAALEYAFEITALLEEYGQAATQKEQAEAGQAGEVGKKPAEAGIPGAGGKKPDLSLWSETRPAPESGSSPCVEKGLGEGWSREDGAGEDIEREMMARREKAGVGRKKSGYDLPLLLKAMEKKLAADSCRVSAKKSPGRSSGNAARETAAAMAESIRPAPLPPEEREAAIFCSNALGARLARLFQARFLKRKIPSRAGRLNFGKLASVAVGNPRIFTREALPGSQGAAIHILLDASNSMGGAPIKLARQACYAAAKALASLRGVNVGVTVFPAGRKGGALPLLGHGQRLSNRFLVEANGGTPLATALWQVWREIQPLPEKRKIVLIISDGMADNLPVVKSTIAAMGKMGVEVYGIEILVNGLKEILPGKSALIKKLSELDPALHGLLQDALLKDRAVSW